MILNEQTITIEQEQIEQIINIEQEPGEQSVSVSRELIMITGAEPYEGAYEVTPTSEAQTLSTEGLRMTANVVINPIPNNYGLITWSGSVLTVS